MSNEKAARVFIIESKKRIRIEVRGTLPIGRNPKALLVLKDPDVSNNHAVIEHKDGKVFITDLGSTNGTQVNGQQLKANQTVQIRHGDRLLIGKTMFDLFVEGVQLVGAEGIRTQLSGGTEFDKSMSLVKRKKGGDGFYAPATYEAAGVKPVPHESISVGSKFVEEVLAKHPGETPEVRREKLEAACSHLESGLIQYEEILREKNELEGMLASKPADAAHAHPNIPKLRLRIKKLREQRHEIDDRIGELEREILDYEERDRIQRLFDEVKRKVAKMEKDKECLIGLQTELGIIRDDIKKK